MSEGALSSSSSSSYPLSTATNKHDLLCVRGDEVFSTSTELFRKVVHYDATDATNDQQPEKTCFVYSYKDGPEYPGPLSRSILVLGYADRSLSVVRKIVDVDTADSDTVVCDGLHSCTIGVQLADEKKRYDRMEKRHKINSMGFARFITNLRISRRVAIISKDKFGRFGILVPFERTKIETESKETTTNGNDKQHNYEANDFAARVYIGDVKEVMRFLAVSSGDGTKLNNTSVNNDGSTSGNNGGWKPSTPPPPSNGWKPISPTYQASGNSWDNNNNDDDDDNDGPKFKPDDDDDGPTFKPDDDDVAEEKTGDSGGAMPWDMTEESAGDSGSGAMPWATTEESAGDSGEAMPWNTTTEESTGDGGGAMPWNNNDTNTGDDDGGVPSSMPWDNSTSNEGEDASSSPPVPWATNTTEDNTSMGNGGSSSKKRSFEDMNPHDDGNDDDDNENEEEGNGNFHTNKGAAAADAFYSGLTRSLRTQDQSWIFHMRKYNNWVKATQIAELDPTIVSVDSKGKRTMLPKQELRIL